VIFDKNEVFFGLDSMTKKLLHDRVLV